MAGNEEARIYKITCDGITEYVQANNISEAGGIATAYFRESHKDALHPQGIWPTHCEVVLVVKVSRILDKDGRNQ